MSLFRRTTFVCEFSSIVLGLILSASAAGPPLERVQTIALRGPADRRLDHMALDGKRNRLFVANMANRSLDVVDLNAGRLLKEIADQREIQGVAYAPDVDRVFVGLGDGGICNAFDGESYRLIQSHRFGEDADNVRYDPRTHRVYVAHAEHFLGVLDARTLAKLAEITLPGFSESFRLEGDKPRLFANVPSRNEVVVVDTDKHEVVQQYRLQRAGANFPMALDESGRRIFVGCRKPPMVVILSMDSGREIGAATIPGDIDDLFFDAARKRLYASCGEGFLAVLRQVDAEHFEMQDKLPTAKLARTCLFDAATSRLFLPVPGHDNIGTEIWVYRALPQ